MEDDEDFDFDFVGNASKKVHANWAKDFNREKSESERTVRQEKALERREKTEREKSDKINPKATSPVKLGKENNIEVIENVKESEESPVSITPPGSPTGGTPSSARAVRGANRTNKTKKALAQLKKTTTISARSENIGLRNVVLALSDEEDGADEACNEDEVEVKVMWKGKVMRVTVGRAEKMGKVMDRVAGMVEVPSNSLLLYRGEESLGREETAGALGLSVATVLQARVRVALEGEAPQGGIELRLQTKDRRSQAVLVTIFPTDQMKEVMDKYIQKIGTSREKVKFFFDGEELEESQTAEDLDMEGGECIDVHLLA